MMWPVTILRRFRDKDGNKFAFVYEMSEEDKKEIERINKEEGREIPVKCWERTCYRTKKSFENTICVNVIVCESNRGHYEALDNLEPFKKRKKIKIYLGQETVW